MHGRDLTGHLLAFSRRRLLNPQPVDANALVADIVKLLGRTLGPSIQLTTRTGAGPCVAFVDPGALEAAVLNIALNARDAMPEGGTLTIATSQVDVAAGSAPDDELKPGAYVQLSLRDTGSGIPPDVAARVFEPFFTTKSGGRGTGLGLSMVYGFAKQSGGTVSIDSQQGQGTTVTLLLPVAAAVDRAAGVRPGAQPAASRKILVVEDEDDVRAIVRRQLEALGHTVLVAAAAPEALLLLQAPTPPDMLLTDIVLGGGMNGVDLATSARRLRPDLPIIFITGYTAVAEARKRVGDLRAPLLTKPFTTPQIERAIQEVVAPAEPLKR
jgi:CheY-like chemotaxis protein